MIYNWNDNIIVFLVIWSMIFYLWLIILTIYIIVLGRKVNLQSTEEVKKE